MFKVVIVVAPKEFRDEEFMEPYTLFKKEGFDVIVASKGVKTAIGKFGTKVNVDEDIDNISPEKLDALVFVGGLGSLIYENDEKILKLVKKVIDNGKILGSICISPRILIKAGILKDKKFTMWNADGSQDPFIKNSGGKYTGRKIEEDDNIITANGPEAASEFAKKIVEAVKLS